MTMMSGVDTTLSRIASIRSAIAPRSPDRAPQLGFDALLARESDGSAAAPGAGPVGPAHSPGSPAAAWANSAVVLASLAENSGSTAPTLQGAELPDREGTAAPPQWAQAFRAASERHNLPPGLLVAVAQVESNFNPNAVSSAGALGLMQFMPGTAAGLGVDPLNPESAIEGAARYLSSHLERFGSIEMALAAYNAGPGAVQRHGGVPPFAETQNYITKVLSAWGSSA